MIKIGKKPYADNFPVRRDIRRDLVDNKCEHCRRAYKSIYIGKKGKECKIILIAHHPNNDTENPDAELIILCRACHGIAQRTYNSEATKKIANNRKIAIKEAAIAMGQMTFLFDENDYQIIQVDFPISQFLQPVLSEEAA